MKESKLQVGSVKKKQWKNYDTNTFSVLRDLQSITSPAFCLTYVVNWPRPLAQLRNTL